VNIAQTTADLDALAIMGFGCVRFLTFTGVNDPFYTSWPKANFLSFPTPTADELAALRQFFEACTTAGLATEFVISLADSVGSYYNNGVTDADYQAFIAAVFPAAFAGACNRLYLGGDLRLGDNDPDPAIVASHRRFVINNWPFFVSLCPPCGLGMELSSSYATFWDRAADSTKWVRENLVRQPNYLGYQLYPSTHAALQALGFEVGGLVDWGAVTRDWIAGLRAAAGPITVMCSEMGLAVGAEFTEQDQAAFLSAALATMVGEGVKTNVWEFADHPVLGDYGLFTKARGMRPAVRAILRGLCVARAAGLLPGVQYVPPEFDDLAWLLPGA
jgi:hypothetical protein